jgi:hypothetical protein
MKDRTATVVVERLDEASRPESGLSPEAVGHALRALEGSRDVTMIISPEGIDERLMAAIDGSHVFLALERSDGLFQFLPGMHDKPEGTVPLEIGGQPTHIEAKYVLDLPTAAIVVAEWLEGGEWSTQGTWEGR